MAAEHTTRQRGLDAFRLPAALLVAAIHTAPFSGLNVEVDALLTYTLGRVAVPFFLMVSGYFVLAPALQDPRGSWGQGVGARRLGRFLARNLLLYLAATVLYLPLTLYAHNLPQTVGAGLRALLWDGTFYHLWYFPALLLGCCLVLMLWRLSPGLCWGWALLGWAAGLLGDSWYGATPAALRAIYDSSCPVVACTRNGLLFAPLFLLLGATAALPKATRPSPADCRRALALFLPLLAAEGLLTWYLDWQRHNSMYLFLPPVVWFLFCLLLRWQPGPRLAPLVRGGRLAGAFYLLHPAVIVLVRGVAKPLRLTGLLVDNALLHWLTVCAVTLALCAAGEALWRQVMAKAKNA